MRVWIERTAEWARSAGRRLEPLGRRLGPLGRRLGPVGRWLLRVGRRLAWEYPRPGRVGWRRWMPSWRQWLGGAAYLIIALVATTGIAFAMTDIPKNLNTFATQQVNVYYWADGTEMARTGPVDRQAVPLGQIPKPVQWDILAAENETFYSDDGVSPRGMMRAVYEMIKGGDTQGGSTITQQYVKNVYLNQQQTVTRKLTEAFIAIKLDSKLSKDQILDGYLNTSWFGRGTYGIERAARAYYGVDVSQLNVSQGAFLASLLKGAGMYDPAISPDNQQRAVTRWKWILDRMVVIHQLTPAQRAQYTTFPEPIQPRLQGGLTGQTGYLVDLATQYVTAHSSVDPRLFDLGGYQIYTTFQKRRVTALAASVKAASKGLDPAKRPADKDVSFGAATVAADGRILAVYGGPDYVKQGFDDANTATVPVGTAFTPLVYAAGLTDGVQLQPGGSRTPVSGTSVYDGDNKMPVQTPEGPYWNKDGQLVKINNDGGRSFGKVTLHQAVVDSINGPMAQLGMDVGLTQLRGTVEKFGLLPASMGEPVPVFPLGNSTPSAIRMADAYGAFPGEGRHVEPYSVSRLLFSGHDVGVDRPQPVQVMTADVAHEVDSALTESVASGAAQGARLPGVEVAGKAGTMLDATSGWFIGYTGQSVTAVTMFHADPNNGLMLPLTGVMGAPAAQPTSTVPTRIFARYTRATASLG
ncbi:transglycosylase domain-containing protein [Streptacidiphilus pinicola]|uniref:transglycosylase domain-containing protein n=1 Tax=Streptacidiphilus pinicola TaxID=2219663 RepID=UPI001FB46F38|nr:transglycosylase domain-containing protein [Streptacidiphilus pinicola]